MQFFVRPVEVVVKFEEHKCRCWLKDLFFCLDVAASVRNEGRKEYLELRRYAKVHHEVEIGELVGIKFAHSIVHLVLLALR